MKKREDISDDIREDIPEDALEGVSNIPFDSEQQFICAACGEANDLSIELSGGYSQSFIEECYACSKPNLISVVIDPETGDVSIGNDIAD